MSPDTERPAITFPDVVFDLAAEVASENRFRGDREELTQEALLWACLNTDRLTEYLALEPEHRNAVIATCMRRHVWKFISAESAAKQPVQPDQAEYAEETVGPKTIGRRAALSNAQMIAVNAGYDDAPTGRQL